jgi:hypothetical protein
MNPPASSSASPANANAGAAANTNSNPNRAPHQRVPLAHFPDIDVDGLSERGYVQLWELNRRYSEQGTANGPPQNPMEGVMTMLGGAEPRNSTATTAAACENPSTFVSPTPGGSLRHQIDSTAVSDDNTARRQVDTVEARFKKMVREVT